MVAWEAAPECLALEEAERVARQAITEMAKAARFRRLRIDSGSKSTCLCPRCRSELERTESWLAGMKGERAEIGANVQGEIAEQLRTTP